MKLKKKADAFLPTRFGKFRVFAFVEDGGKEHLALVRCSHRPHKSIPVRVHSRCLTGDTLTSLRCDCRDQLEASLRYLERKKCGMLIYLDQEGRGIGLANKIRAYALQDRGMDTIEANVHLGFGEDLRDYSAAAAILKYFKVKDISLLTNNPKKIKDLEKHGIRVVERIPLVTKMNRYNRKYLETKRKKMKHLL
ncbi:GTP cyclohydrolase II [Candidatus Micrarchaeota archaeon]|nr:GTP cyclohydrolase II [Candidatus Micrarchaeota archaeon]